MRIEKRGDAFTLYLSIKGEPQVRYSTLRTIQTEDQYRRAMVIRTGTAFMQSPNWLPHQPNIYVYEAGHLLAMPYLDPAAGGEGRIVNTGSLADCSGNYGISPDGRSLAVSCAQAHGGAHQVYVLPAGGTATPLQFTHGAQSFFHAWSPDSRTIAFTRGSASKADIFTVTAAAGGAAAIRIVSLSDGLIRTVTQLQGNRDSF